MEREVDSSVGDASLLAQWNASAASSESCARMVEYRNDANAGSDSESRRASSRIASQRRSSTPSATPRLFTV